MCLDVCCQCIDCCHRSRTEGSWEQRCETRALQAGYLSKFSPGLFFFHSAVSDQVVEDFSCRTETQRKREFKTTTNRSGLNAEIHTSCKNEGKQITRGRTFGRSWPAPPPMCMVSGCFLAVLRRAKCRFLRTEPLLQAQSCCRAGLQQQTLLFPRPTLPANT